MHDLIELSGELLTEARSSTSRRAAHGVYAGQRLPLRQTMVALASGTALAEHQNPGEASLLVLEGRVRLLAQGAASEGGAGHLLVVPPVPHSLEALSDAVVLLTVVGSG